ncbi:MAG: flagellar hook-basal body protein [Bacteriovoracaceae bacterium]|nr:flagellar hook-basal body protein [Bacteriovoracaceae bacterium]
MKDLWVPLSGALAQQRNVETIANNVANANTPGFKRDQLVFKEYLTALDKGLEGIDLPNREWSPKDFYRSQGAEHSKVQVGGSYTIHEQGQLTPTGNSLDFGLNGRGFFEVLTPNGIRYTRRGTFTIDPSGRLVTDQGFPVLSQIDKGTLDVDENGSANLEEIKDPRDRIIQIQGRKLSSTLSGELSLDGKKVAQVAIVEFNDIHSLKKEGNSLFANEDFKNIKVDGAIKTSVHQGFQEQSNVNAIQEMSELIKANRHFGSIQKVIKAYDNMAGKANEIAKF